MSEKVVTSYALMSTFSGHLKTLKNKAGEGEKVVSIMKALHINID